MLVVRLGAWSLLWLTATACAPKAEDAEETRDASAAEARPDGAQVLPPDGSVGAQAQLTASPARPETNISGSWYDPRGLVDAGGALARGPLSASDALFGAEAVLAHNAARTRAPTGQPLPALQWSATLAAIAQAYAEQLATGCEKVLVHSLRAGLGENLASLTFTGGAGADPVYGWAQIVALWESELSCYTPGAFHAGIGATCTDACRSYGGCGHYTQLVWRSTREVGCGSAQCTRASTRRTYWVCNYDPAGNVLGEPPY